MNPLGPLMSFTCNIFPVIQSVNTSTFPWYLMWLLLHNKVCTGIEGSWLFKSSHVFNTEFQNWEVHICNPLKARLFRFEKKHKYFSPKGAKIFFGIWLHLSSARAWNRRPTHCSKNAACICFRSIMLSPPFSKAPQTTVLFTFSKALRLQSFLRHKNLNNILFTWVRTGSGTTNACMIYTNCEIKNVFIMQTLPAMLKFPPPRPPPPPPPALIILLMFYTLPVQFSSTWEAHLSQAKYTPRILSLLFHTNPKKGVSAVLFTTEPHCLWFHPIYLYAWDCGNSAKISNAWCISCWSFKNNVKSSAYSAVFMILSKRPFLDFQ